jgi:hypothetical protein
MEVSGQLHDLVALPPGIEPRYPLNRRLGGPQKRSGRGGEDSSCPCRNSNPDHPDSSLVTTLTDLGNEKVKGKCKVVLVFF